MSNAGLIYVLRPAGQPHPGVPQGRYLRAQHRYPEQVGQAAGQARHRVVGGVLPDQEQKFMYVMNGGTEEVHILDHASGKILSSFGRPGHQIGNFTHGHTIAVDLKGAIYVAETDWGRRIQKFKIVE